MRGTKRAEALTFNVLIVAILAIMVLVVLAVIFVNKSDDASDILAACGPGAFCVPDKAACDTLGGFGSGSDCNLGDDSLDRKGKGTYCCRVFDADQEGSP